MGDDLPKNGTMQVAHIWILLSTCLLVTGASLYVLLIIVMNASSRKSFFLLTICLFSLMYGVGFSIEAMYLWLSPESENAISKLSMIGNFGMNYSHWLF